MELSSKTKKYWTEEDINLLNTVETVSGLFNVAIHVLSRMPKPIIQVCGPITSGGKGDIDENLLVLNSKITELQEKGLNIFNQLVFEDATFRLKDELSKNKYFMDIFTYFYLPIFESGFINELYFLSDWQSSGGVKWEHEQAQRLGIKITYSK